MHIRNGPTIVLYCVNLMHAFHTCIFRQYFSILIKITLHRQVFERLLLFYKCMKRSVCFKAIHEKAEMIKAESNFMSLKESLRAALIFRQFLIGKLFKDDNSESDCDS